MTFAVVMLRSTINAKPDAKKTLELLRLNRINHCVIIPENQYYNGMLKVVKDYVTWGEIDGSTLETLIRTRGGEGAEEGLTDTGFADLTAFSQAVASGKASIKNLSGVEKVFRLHPPRKGHGSIKRPFSIGGALGYRGEHINELIMRMLPEV